MDIISLAFAAFLTENVVLYRFMGVSSIINVTKNKSSSIGMGLILLLVLVLSSVLSWGIYNFVLVPLDLVHFQIMISIAIIITITLLIQLFVKKLFPNYYDVINRILPIATINSSVLGTIYLIQNNNYNFSEVLVFSLFTGLGFMLVSYIFAKLREKIDNSPVPEGFKGVPIILITAAALAIIFGRLGGII